MKKLTGKTFLLLLALSMTVSIFAYGCIWLLLPYADKNQAEQVLGKKAGQLVEKLRESAKEECGELILDFIRVTGAYVTLLDAQGQYVSLFTFQPMEPEAAKEQERQFEHAKIKQPFKMAGGKTKEEYFLIIRYDSSRSEEIAGAILKSMPYTVVVMIALSFVSAWIFSYYTTAPIVRIHKIAGKMAQLDFSWYCPDVRDDEIGMLSKNINELSDKLHAALDELHQRNAVLEDEIALEKERERRQMLFFSGVSHEMKTPLAIVLGQLEGMLAGIGVYKDRDQYLARSAEILQSLNQFIKEILLVAHIDTADPKESRSVSLSELLKKLLEEYAGYAEFYSITLKEELEEGLYVSADTQMIKKALGNVISNGITHSPEHSQVTVQLYHKDREIIFTVINAPAHIAEEHLPRLFDAFYRADPSAGHGSGLGLYITGMILDMYGVSYRMENTDTGVEFTAQFTGV